MLAPQASRAWRSGRAPSVGCQSRVLSHREHLAAPPEPARAPRSEDPAPPSGRRGREAGAVALSAAAPCRCPTRAGALLPAVPRSFTEVEKLKSRRPALPDEKAPLTSGRAWDPPAPHLHRAELAAFPAPRPAAADPGAPRVAEPRALPRPRPARPGPAPPPPPPGPPGHAPDTPLAPPPPLKAQAPARFWGGPGAGRRGAGAGGVLPTSHFLSLQCLSVRLLQLERKLR